MEITTTQFGIIVEFMERNGDLSKPGRPQGGLERKWIDLVHMLNIDTSAYSKPVDIWKKVWSEIKNSTITKAIEIHRSGMDTGGGQPSISALSALELRVLNIVGATSLNVSELGLPKEIITGEPAIVLAKNPPSTSARTATRSRQNFRYGRNPRGTISQSDLMRRLCSGYVWKLLWHRDQAMQLRDQRLQLCDQELQQRNWVCMERRDWRALLTKRINYTFKQHLRRQ